MRGDVMIRGLCDQQAYAIIYIKIGDADADSYKYEPMVALLAWWETINKQNHVKHCHDQQKYFSTFVLSDYFMLGRESLIVLAQLSQ